MDKNIFSKFRGLTTISIGTIVSNGISGIFWLYLARLVGTGDYGEISYFIAIAGLGTMISLLGGGNTITVYTAKKIQIQPPLYLIVIISSTISSIVLFFITSNIYVSINVIGFCLFSLVGFELLGAKRYKKWTILQISQKAIMVIASIILYYELGVNGVIFGIGISYFPMTVIHIVNVFRVKEIDFSLIRSKVKFMTNSYAMELSRSLGSSVDKIIIVPLLGFAMLGNYQLSLQILTILWILPSIIYQYILPLDSTGIPNKKLKIISILISVILALITIILAPVLIPILFPEFIEAIQLIQIVSISIIPNTINTIYISKFLGQEKSKIVLIGSIIFVSVQISTIIILGKIIGINGVAMSLLIAGITEMAYMIYCNNVEDKKQK